MIFLWIVLIAVGVDLSVFLLIGLSLRRMVPRIVAGLLAPKPAKVTLTTISPPDLDVTVTHASS